MTSAVTPPHFSFSETDFADQLKPMDLPATSVKPDSKDRSRQVSLDEASYNAARGITSSGRHRARSLDDVTADRDSRAARNDRSARAEGSRLGGSGCLNKTKPPGLAGSMQNLTMEAEELRSRLIQVNKDISRAAARAQATKALSPRSKSSSSSKTKTVSMDNLGGTSPDEPLEDIPDQPRDSRARTPGGSRIRKMLSRGTSKSGKTSSFSRYV